MLKETFSLMTKFINLIELYLLILKVRINQIQPPACLQLALSVALLVISGAVTGQNHHHLTCGALLLNLLTQ